jgi:hypothetical protein
MGKEESNLNNVNIEMLQQFLKEEVNGRGIWAPETFLKMGFSESFVKDNTIIHKSSKDDYKEIIFYEGEVVDAVEGIFDLDFLMALAEELSADTSGCRARGRGRLAKQYIEAILKSLA